MGTDRNEVLNKPCLCGKGCITICFCRPDHDYAHEGQKWREDKIVCSDCDAKYKIIEQEKNLVLVSRDDHDRAEGAEKQKEQELQNLKKRLWENLEKNGELDSVVKYLNGFKTATAAYRGLSDLYIYRDLADLRKKFPKQSWTINIVKWHIYPRALKKLLNRMDIPCKILDQYFEEDSLVQSRAIPIPRPIGEPILHLNH